LDALSEIRKKLYEKKLESNQKREDVNKVFTLFSVILSLIVVEPIRRWFLLEQLVEQLPAREHIDRVIKEEKPPAIDSNVSASETDGGSTPPSAPAEEVPVSPATKTQCQPPAVSLPEKNNKTADNNHVNKNSTPEYSSEHAKDAEFSQTAGSCASSNLVMWPRMSPELKAVCMYGLGFGLGLGFGVSAVALGVFFILDSRR
jgi:hypothetical protein